MDDMTTATAPIQVVYPETDGKPMGDTDVHIGEYLRPSLRGYRLQEGEYQRLPPVGHEGFASQVLGLELRLEDGRLRVVHPATYERLLTPAAAQVARRAAEARTAQEAAARQVAAEERVAQAEAELQRLRTELARLRNET